MKGKIKIDVTNKNEAMFVTLLASILISSEAISKDLIELAEKYEGMIENKEIPYRISFKFHRSSRRKFDYINPAQTIQDLMVKYGWIEDDNCLFMIPSFEEYEYNKENPGVTIKVL